MKFGSPFLALALLLLVVCLLLGNAPLCVSAQAESFDRTQSRQLQRQEQIKALHIIAEIVVGAATIGTRKSYSLHNLAFDRVSMPDTALKSSGSHFHRRVSGQVWNDFSGSLAPSTPLTMLKLRFNPSLNVCCRKAPSMKLSS